MHEIIGNTTTTPIAPTDLSQVANAIKGKKNGSVILLDDVSPLEHEIKVKLGEVFVKEEPYNTFVKNVDAPTFETTITKSGFYVFKSVDYDTENDGSYFEFEDGNTIESYCWEHEFAVGDAVYVEVNENNYTLYFTTISNGATVQKYGKNLVDYPTFCSDKDGITVSDGVVSGDVNDLAKKCQYPIPSYLAGKIITIRCDVRSDIPGSQFRININNDGNRRITSSFTSGLSTAYNELYFPYECKDGDVFLISGKNADSSKKSFQVYCRNVQMALGEDIVYEAYKDPDPIFVEADGTVSRIIGNGESMTLVAEGGENIEARYNRDANKVIESFVKAIISLGGDL